MRTISGDVLRLELRGYVPLTRNQLRGTHWSVLHTEKKRAASHLLDALHIEAGRELCFESLASAPQTGMGTTLKSFKTFLSTLESWLEMNGTNWKAASSLKRFTKKRKKKPSSK